MSKTKQLPRSRITVQTVTPEVVEEQIEYVKEAVTNFSIPVNEVGLVRSNGSSYDLLWVVPGYGTTTGTGDNTQGRMLADGVLCDLVRSTYKIENLSPYTLFLRLQRPMGYKTDPSALGMWEPATHGKDNLIIPIKPHVTKTFHFANTSTNFMGPRMSMKDGKPCIHLASFALTREFLTDTGLHPSDTDISRQDAVDITVVTHYKANDGNVGKIGEYYVVSYAGSQRLNEINTGPPPSTRIVDLRLQGGNAEFASIIPDQDKDLFLQFVNSKGEQKQDVDGLDKATIYQLPVPIPGKAPGDKSTRYGRFIRWNSADPAYTKQAWIVCDVFYEYSSQWVLKYKYLKPVPDLWPVVHYGTNGLTLFGTDVLRPTASTNYAFKNLLRNKTGRLRTVVKAESRQTQQYLGLSDVEDGILDSLLTALVIIVKVAKVGVEIAGMVGVLALPPPTTAIALNRNEETA